MMVVVRGSKVEACTKIQGLVDGVIKSITEEVC